MTFLGVLNILCSLTIFATSIFLPNHNTEKVFLTLLVSELFEFAIYFLFSTRRSKKFKERYKKYKIENLTSAILLIGLLLTSIAVCFIPYKLEWLDSYFPIIISISLIILEWFCITMFLFAEISIAKTKVKEGLSNKTTKITIYRFIVFLWVVIPFVFLGSEIILRGGI